MSDNTELGYKIRQILNLDVDNLDREVAGRLHLARQHALNHQKAPAGKARLAGVGQEVELELSANVRNFLAFIALTLGAMGTHYWNALEQASEFEEIDSALLADDLPPSAYLDRGFHAWLESASDSRSE